jgi:hypothetical protein
MSTELFMTRGKAFGLDLGRLECQRAAYEYKNVGSGIVFSGIFGIGIGEPHLYLNSSVRRHV